jgi:hypothetical protein
MAISRSQLVKELEPGLNALFGLEYGRYDAQHAEIFETETSDRAFEEEVMLSGFGNARTKSEGGSIVYDNATDLQSLKKLLKIIFMTESQQDIQEHLHVPWQTQNR